MRRPAPSPSRSSNGRHAGPAARSTRMAATLKLALSQCTGIEYPGARQADPGRSSAQRSQRFAPAVQAGFTVNLSADNPAHADRLADMGIAPVVTVLARAYARRAVRHRFKRRADEWAETIGDWRDRTAALPRRTPAGRRIAVCPATYSDATCKTCGACARVRDAVIGFPAHGAWRQVEAATAARDVAVGEPWVFRDHRTMAEVIPDEAIAA